VPNCISLKTGLEEEIGVTESYEVPEFWEGVCDLHKFPNCGTRPKRGNCPGRHQRKLQKCEPARRSDLAAPPGNSNPDMLIQMGICLAQELVRGRGTGCIAHRERSRAVEGMFPYSFSRQLRGICLCDTAGVNW
jgi:hypothetical protein